MKNESERLFLRKYLNETWVSGFKNQSAYLNVDVTWMVIVILLDYAMI